MSITKAQKSDLFLQKNNSSYAANFASISTSMT